MTATIKRATEAECQATLVAAAKRGGWLVHAQRPAMRQSGKWSTAIQGDAGFPDLVCCHPVRGLLFAELKRKPNKVEPAQQKWLDALSKPHGANIPVVVVMWVPEELDAWCDWLVNG